MNDRQRDIIDTATDRVLALVGDLIGSREAEQIADTLYQLALDVLKPPSLTGDVGPTRRMPTAGEVLPPHQRASWAREETEHDASTEHRTTERRQAR
jgi:hypothetical protein